jgi:metallophosphoesterase superfamily enzyme
MLRAKPDLTPDIAPSLRSHIYVCGHAMLPLALGALYWEAEDTLLVADLHLEKGAAYAALGMLLPPYDTRTTLQRLGKALDAVHAVEREIAGHLHPVARIARRGAVIRRRCFATDGSRLVMPAFGAYAGGLNVLDIAFSELFLRHRLEAWMMGRADVYPVLGSLLLPD